MPRMLDCDVPASRPLALTPEQIDTVRIAQERVTTIKTLLRSMLYARGSVAVVFKVEIPFENTRKGEETKQINVLDISPHRLQDMLVDLMNREADCAREAAGVAIDVTVPRRKG